MNLLQLSTHGLRRCSVSNTGCRRTGPQLLLVSILSGMLLIYSAPLYAADALQKADALLAAKKYAAALSSYEAAAAADPDNILAYRGIVKAYQGMGDPQGAVKYMDLLGFDYPANAAACYGLGYALYNMKQYDQALEHFKKAIALKPDMAEAWNNCAAIYHFITRDYRQARTCYEKAIALSTQSGDSRVLEIARANLANLPTKEETAPLNRRLTLEEFVNLFVSRVEENNDRALQLLVLGQKENSEQAMDWLLQQAMQAAAADAPAEEQQALLLARLLEQQYRGSFQSDFLQNKLALYESLSPAQKKQQVRGERLVADAIELEQQGKAQEALQAYRAAVASFRACAQKRLEGTAQLYLGDLLRARRRYQEAREAYNQALTLFIGLRDDRRRAQALAGLGIAGHYLGEEKDARDFLTRARNFYRQLKDEDAAARIQQTLERLQQPSTNP